MSLEENAVRHKRPGPQLMLVRIDTRWLSLKEDLRHELCRRMACEPFPQPPRPVPMNGWCEMLRWTDGNQVCEQMVCYDEHGLIEHVGPIVCQPVPVVNG